MPIINGRMIMPEYDKKVTVYGDDAKYAIMGIENGTLDPNFSQSIAKDIAGGMHSSAFGIVDFVDNILQGSIENSAETRRKRNMNTNIAVMIATNYWREFGGFTYEYISPKGIISRINQEYYLEITPPPPPISAWSVT